MENTITCAGSRVQHNNYLKYNISKHRKPTESKIYFPRNSSQLQNDTFLLEKAAEIIINCTGKLVLN